MRLLVEVGKRGSLTASGQALGMTPSTASRTISDLEDWLGETLLRRTTRNVTLTEAGQQYLTKCQDIIQSVDALKLDSQRNGDRIRGTLRIAASSIVVRYFLSPMLSSFLSEYSEVSLVIDSSDQHVDLSVEKYDMAIRMGVLKDSRLIAQKLLDFRTLLVVAPRYLETRGTPQSLEQLSDFDCLIDTVPRFGNRWPIIPGRKLASRAMIQDGEAIRNLAVAGHGIAFLPDFFVDEDLKVGRLRELFPEKTEQKIGMYAVYLSRAHITPTARAFANAVQEQWKA